MNIIKSVISLIMILSFVFWIITEGSDTTGGRLDTVQNDQATKVTEEKDMPVMLLSVNRKGLDKKLEIFSLSSVIDKITEDKSANSANLAPKKEIKAAIAKTPETSLSIQTAKEEKKPQRKTEEFETIVAKVTAYCPCARCCGRFANGRTSTKTNAWRKGIASDPKVIPYGTVITVPGYATATVDDTGIAMRRSWRNNGIIHIDIRFQYHWQARNWGTKIMRLKIKRPANSFSAKR